jgi:hypothetical protein
MTPFRQSWIRSRAARAISAWRRHYAGYAELHQRRQLLNRPWLEEFMHFSPDGQLHGRLVPPTTKGSTTGRGWCSCSSKTEHLGRHRSDEATSLD